MGRINVSRTQVPELTSAKVVSTTKVKNVDTSSRPVLANGVKKAGRTHIDESRVVVTNGVNAEDATSDELQKEVIDISSADEESDDSEDGDGDDSGPQNSTIATTVPDERGDEFGLDVEMGDSKEHRGAKATREEVAEDEEPSFGDMIRANAADIVDVQASFVDPNAQSLVPSNDKALQQLPSGMSLGTVLTQSLRTNDKDLLETCFHVKDLATIRATIERLDSSFASTLLQRLAERLHNRPGRAGSLMVWIQWTLISHGGYIASQPVVMKKLASLHHVVKERANSLQSLLTLKGKLDMLEAQMNLRKRTSVRSRNRDEMDEDAVVYVEGQDESDSEQPEQAAGAADIDTERQAAQSAIGTERRILSNATDADFSDEDSGSETPQINGRVMDSEDEIAPSDDEGLFDEEAESTDQDSEDNILEDEVDHADNDTQSSDADMSPPPPKRLALIAESKREQ